jgi:hypothetical protein
MSKTKIGPEAKIITLFAALPDDSKRIVLDVIKTQSISPARPQRKAEKPSASPPAQKEAVAAKKVSDALCVAQVPTLDVPCGEREDALIHDPKGGYASYHPFEAAKPVARATRKSRQKKEEPGSTPSSEIETETAIGVGAGD